VQDRQESREREQRFAALVESAASRLPPVPQPTINAVDPSSGPAATRLKLVGERFGAKDALDFSVTVGGATATAKRLSDTVIEVVVPGGSADGAVVVTVGVERANRRGVCRWPRRPLFFEGPASVR
jgi:hypothetical protein